MSLTKPIPFGGDIMPIYIASKLDVRIWLKLYKRGLDTSMEATQ